MLGANKQNTEEGAVSDCDAFRAGVHQTCYQETAAALGGHVFLRDVPALLVPRGRRCSQLAKG